jgi:hypothetical protein
MSEEERRELLKPPANKYDEKWLEIPAFLRRKAFATDFIATSEEFQDNGCTKR